MTKTFAITDEEGMMKSIVGLTDWIQIVNV